MLIQLSLPYTGPAYTPPCWKRIVDQARAEQAAEVPTIAPTTGGGTGGGAGSPDAAPA